MNASMSAKARALSMPEAPKSSIAIATDHLGVHPPGCCWSPWTWSLRLEVGERDGRGHCGAGLVVASAPCGPAPLFERPGASPDVDRAGPRYWRNSSSASGSSPSLGRARFFRCPRTRWWVREMQGPSAHPGTRRNRAFGVTGGLRGRGEREARRDDEECGAAARRVLQGACVDLRSRAVDPELLLKLEATGQTHRRDGAPFAYLCERS
ncbi:hypothetical protein QF040_000007 [Variovorax sp. W2I14]